MADHYIKFEDNVIENYQTKYANDYIYYFNNLGTNVTIDLIGNEWYSLDIETMIISDGSIEINHKL